MDILNNNELKSVKMPLAYTVDIEPVFVTVLCYCEFYNILNDKKVE